eukprot:571877-Alexandrium_andersonii.AAC.1
MPGTTPDGGVEDIDILRLGVHIAAHDDRRPFQETDLGKQGLEETIGLGLGLSHAVPISKAINSEHEDRPLSPNLEHR